MLRTYWLILLMLLSFSVNSLAGEVVLLKEKVSIVMDKKMPAPVKFAVDNLRRDFSKTMGFTPTVGKGARGDVQLVIVDDEVGRVKGVSKLGGFEAHEVKTDAENNRIIIHGYDMRGTIFAIYTFSEKVLGVPPLWYYCSWTPRVSNRKTTDINFFMRSPQVRFRAWFPNDTDLFTPWRKLSKANNEMWLETLLRLKLNCVELEATVTYPNYKMNAEAELVRKYGIVLTSHHHVALNNSFVNWDGYWREVRHEDPARHKPSVHNLRDLKDFWTYNIKTVHRSGIENLWQVTFRGRGDQPFWALFKDAPESEAERGKMISDMMNIQVDLIKKITGEKNPYVRTTFYDEMSNLLAKGYITPPSGKNMIWTYVAARRDHYPNDDLVSFDVRKTPVRLGYYLNLQFTSTGAHLCEAEGPWKMEENFRYVHSKAPLYFSVVNMGNVREFLLSASANAAMLWDFKAYDTDTFLKQYCAQYFGAQYATQIADLYQKYFYAFWNQQPSTFPGVHRQYIFQDMRYARAFDQILGRFDDYSPNPLRDIGFESVKGRTFRIPGEHQVDSMIKGVGNSASRFAAVAARCRTLLPLLPKESQMFFEDNLLILAEFMSSLGISLTNFLKAYQKNGEDDKMQTEAYLKFSLAGLKQSRDMLYSNQRGVFSDWYAGERLFGIQKKINGLENLIKK
ncbi:MAG: glycosyl hydrolase 115 family protein [Prevotella sp.]|jgi:hypothetical protein